MEYFIAISGFLGAWLLVAGPIYQAALELREEDFARDRIRELANQVEVPPKISTWWWLVPPVKIFLEHRRGEQYRHNHFAALSIEDTEALLSYMSKAIGWMLVASGGFLLAIKETYELTEIFEWHEWFVFPTAVLMFVASILYTITASRRQAKIMRQKQ